MPAWAVLTLLIVGELFLVATGLAVFLYLRGRNRVEVVQEAADTSLPVADVAALVRKAVETEIQRCRQKLARMQQGTGATPDQAEERRLLDKRVAYLEVELEALPRADKSDMWPELQAKLAAIFSSEAPAAPPESPEPLDPELQELRDMLKQETSAIEEILKALVEAQKDPDALLRVEVKLGEMERFQRDLRMCLEVIKGEQQRKRGAGPGI